MININPTAIEYVINPDGTQGFNWSIITGCLHPCRDAYCYNTMKKTSPLNRFYKDNRKKETGELHFAKPEEGIYPYGFDPTVYLHRLEEPKHRKKSSTIFVANGGDILGEWIFPEIINSILDIIRQCPQHTFIILTKNYKRLYEFDFPDNAWVGTTQEYGVYEYMSSTFSVDGEIHQKIPLFGMGCLCNLTGIKAKTRFISFEPLHEGQDTGRIPFEGVTWVVIGAESGTRAKHMIPKRDCVLTLVKSAQDQGIPVWMKNNLAPEPFNKSELIQELPKRGRCPHCGKLMPKSVTKTHQPYWDCEQHGLYLESYFDAKQ